MLKKLLIIGLLLLNFSVIAEDVHLTPTNHIILNGEVNSKSVGKLSDQLLQMSISLPKDATIYFVIDSGGGSVFDGIDLLNVMEAVPQKIVSVSIFAFSMAYSISQRADTRLIATNGIMGQHRARGTFSGQFADGEVEQKLAMVTSVITSLNNYEAKKMGVSLLRFRSLIKDEMWAYDTDAVDKKVADGIAHMTCSKELIEDYKVEERNSIYGTSYRITYSSCPLIRNPIKVEEIENEK